MLERKDSLDQSSDPGGGIDVTDVRLDRTDATKAVPFGRLASKRPFKRGELYRITYRRSGSMGFDIADVLRADTGMILRLHNHAHLTVDAGRRKARLVRTIVVDRPPANNRVDSVAIDQRLFKSFEDDGTDAIAEDRSGRFGVKRPAMTVTEVHPARLMASPAFLWKRHRHPAGNRNVTLADHEGLTRLGHGD